MVLGFTYLDLLAICLYLGVIIYIGIRASFKIKNQEDFLLGGRKFGKLVSIFASFGQATSADGPTGVSTTTYNNGASGIWSSLLMLFVTPLFWITAPWLRRMRILTMGDFYVERYGSVRMGATYAIIASIGMMGLLSVGYMAISKTTLAMSVKPMSELSVAETIEYGQAQRLVELEALDLSKLSEREKEEMATLRAQEPRSQFSYLNENWIIWGVCLLVMMYALIGGLEAAFYTDLLQGLFIIVLSVILLPYAWHAINVEFGGNGITNAFTHLHQQLSQSNFEIFGSPKVIDFTWYFIIMAALVSGITVVTQPNQLVTAGAAKDEYTARIGFVTGTFLKRIMTVLWGVLGLFAIVLFAGEVSNSDLVWGHATKALLGPLNFGLVGLMLASMMAALMSTADCLMITVSGLIVNNVYKPFFGRDTSEKNMVLASRISGAVFLIGGAMVTTQFDEILQVLKFIWEFFVIFAAAFWLGLKWRKANRIGAWNSILISFSLFYLIPILLPTMIPSLRNHTALLKETKPNPIERVYVANQSDVEMRTLEIAQWEALVQRETQRPESLEVGDSYTKTYQLPQKSIFWSKGHALDQDNRRVGQGYIYLELLMLDAIGFDLSKNAFSLNETIRMGIRLFLPFILLLLFSRLYKIDQDQHIRRFFGKMRTPVSIEGPAHDRALVASGIAQFKPESSILLFPKSNWEFYRWNRQDLIGVLLSVLMVILILMLFKFFTVFGA